MPGQQRRPEAERGKVIAMADFFEARRYRAAAMVEAYWQALRGTRLMPARSEVDPRRIEDALEHAFLLERIAPRHGRLRIAGRHLCDLAGTEVRGMPLSALFDATGRTALGEALEQVMDGPGLVTLDIAAPAGLGRAALEGRLLMFPLRSDLGDVSRVLGCLETTGAIGRPPRRLQVLATRVTPLVAEAGPPAPSEIAPGFAEATETYDPGPPRPRRKAPHLRLVSTQDDD